MKELALILLIDGSAAFIIIYTEITAETSDILNSFIDYICRRFKSDRQKSPAKREDRLYGAVNIPQE